MASRDADRAAAVRRGAVDPALARLLRGAAGRPGVDAVYIPLPNGLHAPWTLAALEAGKHVLCEKPVAADPEDVERAVRRWPSERGLVLTEAFMWRHQPQTQAMCELVAQGAVGELRMIRRRSRSCSSARATPRLEPAARAAALMDVGCYCVSAAGCSPASPSAVTAQACARSAPTGSTCGSRRRCASRATCLAHFDCGFDLPRGRPAGRRLRGASSWSTTRGSAWSRASGPRARTGRSRGSRSRPADPYRAQLDDFAGAVADGRRPLLGRAEVVGQARSLQALLRAMSNDEEDVR